MSEPNSTEKKTSPTEIGTNAERALFSGQVSGLVALCYANERPLQGLAGLLDWRFHGKISDYIRSGSITGSPGECAYVPIRKQDRTYHLILAGAGFNEMQGRRGEVPPETLQALAKNLRTIGIDNVGVSSKDFGGASLEYFGEHLKGAGICVVQ